MKRFFIITLLAPLFLISCGKSEEVKTVMNPPVMEKQAVVTPPIVESPVVATGGVMENDSGKTEETITGVTTESDAGKVEETSTGVTSEGGIIDSQTEANNFVSFSDEEIKNILVKIDENTKKHQDQEKNSASILIQDDFKAEYIAPKDYSKDTDKIITTVSGVKYELSGIYGEKEKQKYLDIISKGGCKAEKGEIVENPTIINTISYRPPTSGDCLMQQDLNGFLSFSPSGYYLLYKYGGWEYEGASLVDSKTGKSIIKIDYPEYHVWTLDKKQFIYAGGAEIGGCSNGCGLHITIKNNFPKDKVLTDDFIDGGYIDENNLYVKTYSYNSNKKIDYLRVYNLTTLKEVFSKEIIN